MTISAEDIVLAFDRVIQHSRKIQADAETRRLQERIVGRGVSRRLMQDILLVAGPDAIAAAIEGGDTESQRYYCYQTSGILQTLTERRDGVVMDERRLHLLGQQAALRLLDKAHSGIVLRSHDEVEDELPLAKLPLGGTLCLRGGAFEVIVLEDFTTGNLTCRVDLFAFPLRSGRPVWPAWK